MSASQRQLSNSTMKQRGEDLSNKVELEIPPILGMDNDYSFIEKIHDKTWNNLSPPK
jgi:hypothetical protein